MKTIKFILIVCLVSITGIILNAQGANNEQTTGNTPGQYTIPVTDLKNSKLILKNFSDQLPVEGYNGKEIIITTEPEIANPPERAKGLKPLYSDVDNTGLGLNLEKNDNLYSISCLLPFTRHAEYKIKVPENMSVEISSDCERTNSVNVSKMKNEIEIKNCHNIDLKDVSGPLILSTISGNITITYEGINSEKSSSINSVSGDIDITIPLKTALNIEMRTISGGFYSDFDFNDTQKNLKKVGGNVLDFPLNGGGTKFTLNTISGNIYLRKGK
jgi:lia operon protein LiaG